MCACTCCYGGLYKKIFKAYFSPLSRRVSFPVHSSIHIYDFDVLSCSYRYIPHGDNGGGGGGSGGFSPRARGFWENVLQFIPRLRFLFVCSGDWLAHTNSTV